MPCRRTKATRERMGRHLAIQKRMEVLSLCPYNTK
jgi:hypothetical protein